MKGGPETIARKRLREIDLLRGLAVVLMIIFHLGYDLAEFFHQPVTWQTGWLYATGKTAAIMFVFLAGLSSTFSRNNGKRGLKLLVLALGITWVTSLAVPGSNIIFGILHCLGTSMIVYLWLQKQPPLLLGLAGLAVIAVGQYLPAYPVTGNWLLPFGLRPANFYAADYFPLFPWFGVFLTGTAAGKLFYPGRHSLIKFPLPDNPLNLLGRHSLLVYLVHQPLLLAGLFLWQTTLLRP